MKSKVNPKIFRAYDIRGKYPKEINEETAYKIGRAFVKFLSPVRKKNLKIAVGRDSRVSSPVLCKNLIKGIIESGADVVVLGIVTTPMLYFGVAELKCDGGIIITASHNPRQYNGFKLVREKAKPISGKTGLKEIKKLSIGARMGLGRVSGTIVKKDILKDYLKFSQKDFNLRHFKFFKIVVDTANAVPGILIPDLMKALNCKVYHLFKKLDGNFPNHNPDPFVKKNLKTLCKMVKDKKADLGAAFDGDGDRIIFLDEKGKIIPSDLILALLAEKILKEKPGSKILYDIRCSNIVKEIILKNKGKPISTRVGHSFIKEKMRNRDILFGGELSGHFYHKKHNFCESPIFVLLKILQIISEKGIVFSEIIQPFKKYYHSGEINFKVKNKEKILKVLEKKYHTGIVSHLDGLRIDFKNFWFLARASNTESVLRLVIEAKTKELMKKKKKELIEFIKKA